MKKSLLGLFLAVVLVAPSFAANWWVGGLVGYDYSKAKDKDSQHNVSVIPEIGYNIDENWDIGLNLNYEYNNADTSLITAESEISEDTRRDYGVSVFARYKMFSIGDFSVLAKGGFCYKNSKFDKLDTSLNNYQVSIAPIIKYDINDSWSIECLLTFATLNYEHLTGEDDYTKDIFGFKGNEGSIVNIGFAYHF